MRHYRITPVKSKIHGVIYFIERRRFLLFWEKIDLSDNLYDAEEILINLEKK